MNIVAFLFIAVILILAFYPDIKASIESEGVFKCDKSALKDDAKVINVKTGTAGSKVKRKFRIVVQFDDDSKYIKVVNPGTTETHFTTQRIMLHPHQQKEVIEEAISKHNSYLHDKDNIINKQASVVSKNENKEDTVCQIISTVNDVFNSLNEYMLEHQEVVLDSSKQKRLDKDEKGVDITNTSKCYLVSYYCAVIEYWSGKKDLSNKLIEYCNTYCSIIDNLNMKNTQNKLKDFTKHVLELNTAAYIKRMNATKERNLNESITLLGENFLNENFNQKCSDYNITILKNSANKILEFI